MDGFSTPLLVEGGSLMQGELIVLRLEYRSTSAALTASSRDGCQRGAYPLSMIPDRIPS